MGEQSAARTPCSATAGDNTDAIIGHNYFQIVAFTIIRCAKSKAKVAVDIVSTCMASSVPQGFLHSCKDQFCNSGRRHFVYSSCRLFRDTPLYFIKCILKVLLQHGLYRMHHAITLQTMWRAGSSCTHHGCESAMGITDHINSFIQSLFATHV